MFPKIVGSVIVPLSVTHVQGGLTCANGTHYFVDAGTACFCGQITPTTIGGLRVEPVKK